jgi:hypothetical protein
MARTPEQIQRELTLNQELAASLADRQEELLAELDKAKAAPGEPRQSDRYSVEVKFASHGKKYEFLLLRSPDGAWYTTGTGAQVKRLRDWAALVAWLQGPDVHWHSDLRVLTKSAQVYSLQQGWGMDDGGDAPF